MAKCIFFSELFEGAKKRRKFFDDLSDDEEYQNMTEEERNEKMTPQSMSSKLNLDGALSFDDSSDDEKLVTSKKSTKHRRKKSAKIESDDEVFHLYYITMNSDWLYRDILAVAVFWIGTRNSARDKTMKCD